MQSCVLCGSQPVVVHPREPDRRCGRGSELLPDPGVLQRCPPPAPRRLPPMAHFHSLGSLGSLALFLGFMLLITPGVFLANLVGLVTRLESPGVAVSQMLTACVGAGILLLALGWLWRVAGKVTSLARKGNSSLGVVVEVDYGDADTSGTITYAYRVEGRPIPIEATITQGRLDLTTLQVGQLVHVIYASDQPSNSLLYLNGAFHS